MFFDICLKNIRQAFCANTFQRKLFAKKLIYLHNKQDFKIKKYIEIVLTAISSK